MQIEVSPYRELAESFREWHAAGAVEAAVGGVASGSPLSTSALFPTSEQLS